LTDVLHSPKVKMVGNLLRGCCFIALAACATSLSNRASQIRWVESPQQVAGCEYLGIVDGSSMQTGAANISTGRNNARNEALNHAAEKGATHVHWLTNDESFSGIRITAEAYDCGKSNRRVPDVDDDDDDREVAQVRHAKRHHADEADPVEQPKPNPSPPTAEPSVSLGSCFFVSPDGIAVTNRHVVAGAKKIVVIDASNEKHAATVLRTSADADLVALDVPDATKHAAVPIETSVGLKLGQAIFTIGFPYATRLGFDPKYSDGAVGGLKGLGDDRLLQVTIPIQPGNSGGPVATDSGVVVGVVVAKLNELAMLKDTGTLPQNVNFAIKSSELAALLRGVNLATAKKTSSRADAIARVQAASCQVIAFESDDVPSGSGGDGDAGQPRTTARGDDNDVERSDEGASSSSEPLSKQQVAAGVSALQDKLTACKDAEDDTDITAVKVKAQVAASGAVLNVTVDGSAEPENPVRKCILKAFRSAQFPKSAGGKFTYSVKVSN
jgi:S1-C subfamily serine protease